MPELDQTISRFIFHNHFNVYSQFESNGIRDRATFELSSRNPIDDISNSLLSVVDF